MQNGWKNKNIPMNDWRNEWMCQHANSSENHPNKNRETLTKPWYSLNVKINLHYFVFFFFFWNVQLVRTVCSVVECSVYYYFITPSSIMMANIASVLNVQSRHSIEIEIETVTSFAVYMCFSSPFAWWISDCISK